MYVVYLLCINKVMCASTAAATTVTSQTCSSTKDRNKFQFPSPAKTWWTILDYFDVSRDDSVLSRDVTNGDEAFGDGLLEIAPKLRCTSSQSV